MVWPLQNILTEEHDEISLAPGQGERRDLLGILSDKSSSPPQSIASASGLKNKNERFQCYTLNDKTVPASTNDMFLRDLFGDSEAPQENSGLLLDTVQLDILAKSWRSSDPDRISAYK